MRWELKFKLILWKHYLDKGMALTDKIKYAFGLFAVYEIVKLDNLKITIMLLIIWAIFSFILGWWWYRNDWNKAEIEVTNRINPFVTEVREALKNGKV